MLTAGRPFPIARTTPLLRYRVSGQLFFASADLFAANFEHHGHPRRVEIDMTDAHLWDLTGVAAVDKVVFRYRRQGADVALIGMNQAGQTLVDQLGKHDKSHLPAGAAPTSQGRPSNGFRRRESLLGGSRLATLSRAAPKTPTCLPAMRRAPSRVTGSSRTLSTGAGPDSHFTSSKRACLIA